MQSKNTVKVLLIAAALIAPARFVSADEVVPRVDIERRQDDGAQRPASPEDAKARSRADADHGKADADHGKAHADHGKGRPDTSEPGAKGQAVASEHRNAHGEAGYQAAMERREAARARHDAALGRRDAARERREAAKEHRAAGEERKQGAMERRDAAHGRSESAREAHAPAR
ncbi:MAG TPA: hypothetical protein VK524_12215 [Polyangiaceae bacterium]|nr:hypothetical protein [Polyangiaceae bacterium]